MANTTSQTPRTWLPEQTGDLVLRPVEAASVAITAVGNVVAPTGTGAYRVPVVNADPSAAWTAEGSEIAVSDIDLDETADQFHKLAGLSVISRELADDSDPGVAEQIGQGLARDIATRLDESFFGSRGSSTLQPQGLEDLDGVTVHSAGSAWSNSDAFTSAQYGAEAVGAHLAAFIAHPADALALAQVKQADGSNLPLLSASATEATQRVIGGVPLLTSPAVTEGTVWGLPADGRIVIVVREDIRVERDGSAYFSSDRIGIRATMRSTVLYPHAAAIQKIELNSGS